MNLNDFQKSCYMYLAQDKRMLNLINLSQFVDSQTGGINNALLQYGLNGMDASKFSTEILRDTFGAIIGLMAILEYSKVDTETLMKEWFGDDGSIMTSKPQTEEFNVFEHRQANVES
jgi:hypothetical protein